MLDFSHPSRFQGSKTQEPSTQTPPTGFYAGIGKRVFDVSLALLLLPILAPVIFVLWCLVRRDGGPGFFGHTRIGKGGKPFKCWKIRSMVVDAEEKLQAYLDANPDDLRSSVSRISPSPTTTSFLPDWLNASIARSARLYDTISPASK